MYRTFGSAVTLIEALPRIVPVEDEEVSAELARAFNKRGIKVLAGAKMTAMQQADGGVKVSLTDAEGKQQELIACLLYTSRCV